MLNKFFKVILSKWEFSKPQKKKLLIYDLPNLFEKILTKDQYEVLDIRYKAVNIYILLITFLQTGFKDLVKNYQKNYILSVSPKIIITSIDNNLFFFKLKQLYDKAKYICVQLSLRDSVFLNSCKMHYKNKNATKLYSDYFFVYGNNDKTILKKFIQSKFILSGSVINNLYIKKKNNNKIDKIIFINQTTEDDFEKKTKIFKKIIKLSKELNLSLYYLLKRKEDHLLTKKIKKVFKKEFLNKEFNYIKNKKYNVYDYLSTNAIFFTSSSTLGFEAISRKSKVIFLPYTKFPGKDYFKKYPSHGPFWTTDHSFENIKNLSKNVLNLNKKKWASTVDKIIPDIINFKAKNPILLKLLIKNKIRIINKSI